MPPAGSRGAVEVGLRHRGRQRIEAAQAIGRISFHTLAPKSVPEGGKSDAACTEGRQEVELVVTAGTDAASAAGGHGIPAADRDTLAKVRELLDGL